MRTAAFGNERSSSARTRIGVALVLSVGAALLVPAVAASARAAPEDEPHATICSEVGSPISGVCELWVARYDAPGGSWDSAADVVAAPDGSRVFVTGQSGGGPYSQDGDYATVAYDASTGARLWVARYDGPGGAGPFFGSGDGWDEAKAIAVSPDGALVYVTGSSWGGKDTNMDHATIAYDAATGEERWIARYDGTGGIDVAVSADGTRLFVTGGAFSDPTVKADYGTVAYDALTGEELWVAEYNNPAGNREDVAKAVAVSPDGSRAFVTGWSLPETGFARAFTTIAYDAVSGEELWISSYARGNAEPTGLRVGPDGTTIFVAGNAGSSAATVAYDSATGAQRWDSISTFTGSTYINALEVDHDGSRVYIAGTVENDDTKGDYLTIAYDAATGAAAWSQMYDGHCGNHDEAYSLVAGRDGRLYVTGGSWSHGDCSIQDLERTINAVDYTTIAYDSATGEQHWISRYDGGGGWDVAVAAALAPAADRLFVTGWSRGGRGPSDYATVAYEIGPGAPPPPSPPGDPGTASPSPAPSSRHSYPVTPDDEYFTDQWGVQTIQAPQAWQLTRATGSGIRVAVVDTGVDLDHEDLQCPDKIEVFPGSDVVKDGNGPDDFQGHGTHVAGIIAACTHNATGVAGVAPDATIMPVQVFDPDGGSFEDVTTGIRRATGAGAHVINLSLGPQIGPISHVPGLFDDVEEAIAEARAAGVVLVAAAGNDSMPLCGYPALSRHVICVGASDSRDLKAWYSTFPNKPGLDRFAVVAPGGTETVAFCNIPEETILSLWPRVLDNCNEGRSGYQDMAGTSMAAPHVAGAAALVYDRLGGTRTAENASAVIDAIVTNAKDLGPPGYDPVFGSGRVDVLAAVQAIEVVDPDPSTTTSPSSSPGPQSTDVEFTDDSATAAQYSDETFLEARLATSDGEPVGGAELTFELVGSEDERTLTAVTDDDGIASVTPVVTEKPGSYQLTVRFAGDDDHEPSTDTTGFVIDREDTDLELTVAGRGSQRTLEARLADHDTPAHGIATRTVDFYGDGELIGSATTDNDGVATLQAPPRYRGGRHDFEARFAGDDFYRPSSARRST